MRCVAMLLLLLLVLQICVAAQEIGTLTVMEGGLRLIRGVMIMQAVEGTRLRQGDILQSSEQGFDQLEFVDGTVVALGPSSQVFLLHIASGRSGSAEVPATELVLLGGWLKGNTPSGSAASRYASPLLGAATQDGTVNIHAQADVTSLFVESGSVLIGEVSPESNWKKIGVGKQGQFFSRSRGNAVGTAAKPSQTFISSMPQAFRDTLPSRMARFTGKSVQPIRQRQATFSDILPLLSMGRPWRMSLVRRFESLASNPAFRAAMEAHLKEFPEWVPVLHPRKNSFLTPASDNANSGSQNNEADSKIQSRSAACLRHRVCGRRIDFLPSFAAECRTGDS